MKHSRKEVVVKWVPVNSAKFITSAEHFYDTSNLVDELYMEEPVRLTSSLAQDTKREYINSTPTSAEYRRCPGYIDLLRNVFEIRSIADMSFEISEDRKIINIDAPVWLKGRIQFRSAPNKDTYILVSLGLFTLFYSESPVRMEQLPPFLAMGERTADFTIVPGAFDIDKWIRPVEVAIEIKHHVTCLKIKKGDPLSYVRFITPDNLPVRLERTELTNELDELAASCLAVKNIEPQNSMVQNYARMSGKIASLFGKKSLCPFKRFLK